MKRSHMAQPMLKFPAFDAWLRMNEREQDALLDRMEAAQYWRWQAKRALIAVGCGAASLTLGVLIGLIMR
jgi:hypothetical protein